MNFLVMAGKQLANNLIEFFYAMRRTIKRICFERGEPDAQEQWEKDNQLFDFNSNTLIDEYLEIGKRLFNLKSMKIYQFYAVIQFGFVTLFVAAFPYVK